MNVKVINTREIPLTENLADKLISAGFESVHLPLIKHEAKKIPEGAIDFLNEADWIFLTSAVAVNFFKPFLPSRPIKLATIGPQTSYSLREHGFDINLEASSYYGSDLVKEWLDLGFEKQKILLPQSSLANPKLAQTLLQTGHEVFEWFLYDTVPNMEVAEEFLVYLSEERVVWTFASPSAWKSFEERVKALPKDHLIVAIGQTTARSIRRSGYQVDLVPEKPSFSEMVTMIIEKVGKKNDI